MVQAHEDFFRVHNLLYIYIHTQNGIVDILNVTKQYNKIICVSRYSFSKF